MNIDWIAKIRRRAIATRDRIKAKGIWSPAETEALLLADEVLQYIDSLSAIDAKEGQVCPVLVSVEEGIVKIKELWAEINLRQEMMTHLLTEKPAAPAPEPKMDDGRTKDQFIKDETISPEPEYFAPAQASTDGIVQIGPALDAPEPEEEELAFALAAIEKAHGEVSALCNGKRWIMSVPAREDEDSDLVIANALHKAKALLARLSPPAPREVHACAVCSTTPAPADERMVCKQCIDAFFADSAPKEVPMAMLVAARNYIPS